MVKKQLLLLVYIFLISSNFIVSAEETNNGSPQIIISTTTYDKNDDNSLLDLINESISLEFQINRFSTDIDLNTDLDDALHNADLSGATYLIRSNYSVTDNDLFIEMHGIRVANGVEIYSVRFESTINLDFDSRIKKSLEPLIAKIKKNFMENPPLTAEIIEPIIIKDEIYKDEIFDTKEVVTEMEDEEEDIFRHLEIFLGFSPFLTTGDASEFFTLGLVPEMSFIYKRQTPFGYWGIGLFSSFNFFSASGNLDTSDNCLISLGPEIKLGFKSTKLLTLNIKLNGGMTFFLHKKENEDYLNSIVPFISGGIGLTIDFLPSLGAYFSGIYILYAESSVLITGFSPSIGMIFKF